MAPRIHRQREQQQHQTVDESGGDVRERVGPSVPEEGQRHEPDHRARDQRSVRNLADLRVHQGKQEQAAQSAPVAQAQRRKAKAQQAGDGEQGKKELGEEIARGNLRAAMTAAAAEEEPAQQRDQVGNAERPPAVRAAAAALEKALAAGNAPGGAVEERTHGRAQHDGKDNAPGQQAGRQISDTHRNHPSGSPALRGSERSQRRFRGPASRRSGR